MDLVEWVSGDGDGGGRSGRLGTAIASEDGRGGKDGRGSRSGDDGGDGDGTFHP